MHCTSTDPIINSPHEFRSTCSRLELCNSNRYRLLIRVTDTDVDLLHTNAIGVLLGLTVQLC
jgi:hypothetical protein